MTNRSDVTETNGDRLRSTSTSATNRRTNTNNCSINMEDIDGNDVMMQGDDDDDDNNSIPTTMGVRASCMELSNRNRSACHLRDRTENYATNDNISVAENISNFFIPLPIPAPGQAATSATQQQMNVDNSDCDDEISTLTEYSMEEMKNEDDNLSQTTTTTTWTWVTEGTGSTTAATPAIPHGQNFVGASENRKLARRRLLANKRTRVQQSQETGNPVLFRDPKTNGDNNHHHLKRRRKT